MKLRLDEAGTRVRGYRASPDSAARVGDWETTTAEYAQHQLLDNARITREFLIPILRSTGSRTVVDVGCGVGESVQTLVEEGYESYGIDLACLAPLWEDLGRSPERFFVVEPDRHVLPFESDSIDFAFSLGVIEHVGTADGHATRTPDYHARRAYWLREIFRIVRPGGHLLIGGPNRGFPFDFSHDLDAGAGRVEHWLSRALRVSVHRTWGDYFLWGYADFPAYLSGLDYQLQALSIQNLLRYSRVPRHLRRLARLYVDYLPTPFRATGFNPWVMALIQKGSADARPIAMGSTA